MSAWEASVGASNEWYTPPYVFDALGCRFDLDVAAPNGDCHVPARTFFNCDSLYVPWHGFVWMNPPFGGRGELMPWLERFFAHGDGVALTPDRTSAPWFRFAASRADLLLTMPKVDFLKPDGTTGKNSNGSGTVLWAAGGRGIAALISAANADCGNLFVPFFRQGATRVQTFKRRTKGLASALHPSTQARASDE